MCGGCNTCRRAAAGLTCGSWCNSFTCGFSQCTGCPTCGGLAYNHTNMCGYNNDRPATFVSTQLVPRGFSCTTIVDENYAGATTTSAAISTDTTTGGTAGAGAKYCIGTGFGGGSGYLDYGAFCPNECLKNPVCVTHDQDSVVHGVWPSFGVGCAGLAGFCTHPSWIGSFLSTVCPVTCGGAGSGRRSLSDVPFTDTVIVDGKELKLSELREHFEGYFVVAK